MLTMRTSTCLNLLPIPSKKPSNSSLISTIAKPPQEGWWRRQYAVIGVASCCTIIGLELCNSVVTLKHGDQVAIAKEEIMSVSSKSNPLLSVSVGGAKWSEKRACLPWRGNSLETIVPENLPRPATRRRYEDVHSTSKTAPPLSHSSIIIIKHKTNRHNCFSM